MLIAYAGHAWFGEPWCRWSWLELSGFIVLIVGTLVYNTVLKLPGFTYPGPENMRLVSME
jgi:hypothetical protein